MFNVNMYIRVDLDPEDKARVKDAIDTIQEIVDGILDCTGNGNSWTDVLEDAQSVLIKILNGSVY